MFRVVALFVCFSLCHSHAVLPFVVPAAHTLHTAPLVVPYPLHGYGYGHGLLGNGFLDHGYLAKPLAHHILKRSPHYSPLLHEGLGHIAPLAHVGHVAPVAHIAPVAFSHQSRVDVHTSPAVVAAPILPLVKPLVTPVLSAPILHKSLAHYGVGDYGAGHYGALYPHHTHYSHY